MDIQENFAHLLLVDELQSFVIERFNLAGQLVPLPGEYDLNFRLILPDRPDVVVKLMHPTRNDEWVDLQIALLAHLAINHRLAQIPRLEATVDQQFVTPFPLSNGEVTQVWVQEFLPGQLLAQTDPHSEVLLRHLGRTLATVDQALLDFTHPAVERELKWDLKQAAWIENHFEALEEPSKRAMVEKFWEKIKRETLPYLDALPHGVVHNDANDYNVLTISPLDGPQQVSGLIDFGDALFTVLLSDLAIGGAYGILDKADPVSALVEITAGYHAVRPLMETEISHLFNLVCLRLCVSVVNAALGKIQNPDDGYVVISERPAWEALARLAEANSELVFYRLRQACGLPPFPGEAALVGWLKSHRDSFHPVISLDPQTQPVTVLDLSVSSLMLGADPAAATVDPLTRAIKGLLAKSKTAVAVGGYNEARLIYDDPLFGGGSVLDKERRTVHLGLDLWVPAGEPIFAPLAGIVHEVTENAAHFDYGPLVILKHEPVGIDPFYTLYGHLSRDTLSFLEVGQEVAAGEQIGTIGAPPINGNWPPHLHLQIIGDLLGMGRDFPGVAPPDQRELWLSLSPDPNLMVGIPDHYFPDPPLSRSATIALRQKLLGRNLRLSYQQPLKIVRGWQQYLYDEDGRAFLDVYNNVPHVGHSHPRVVEAIQRQTALLNTNTRYLHENILRYAAALTDLLPDPLQVCYFLNSASEANELALRLARAYSGRRAVIVLDAAYHGHTTTLIDLSPYKFAGPGGQGQQPGVYVAPLPDDYRGAFRRNDKDAGVKYGRQIKDLIANIQADGDGIGAFLAESLPSVGGQIVFPAGYLQEAYRHVRVAGGVCIADEVQTGLGRVGSHMWGFELQGVVPDIVVLGKPIANGHPVAAVITTPAIAKAFDNGMEFFSTFGGNPVSCAAGLAVLQVLHEENLPANAAAVGGDLLAGLQRFVDRYPFVGDARGAGLFLGMEMVRDRDDLTPSAAAASYVVRRLQENRILAGTDGPHHNVVKIRPPMVFSRANGRFFLETVQNILDETPFDNLF